MDVPYSFPRGKRGIYQYRRRVPEDVQPVVGKAWWKISLKTPLPADARRLAIAQAAEHDALIARHRALPASRRALADFEAYQRANARDVAEVPSVPAHKLADRARLWDERQAAIERLALSMLSEAEKRLGTLSEGERAMVDASGGVASLSRQTTFQASVNQHLRDIVATSEIDASAPPAEQFIEREEREREERELTDDAGRIRKRTAVLEKLALRASKDEIEEPGNPRINTILQRWLAHQGQGPASAQRHRVAWRVFVEKFGNIPVREITRAQVLQYRDVCEKIPDTRRVASKQRGRPLSEVQAKGLPVISSETVNRYLNSIKAMLRWCRSNVADFNENVASGIVAAKGKRKKIRSFTPAELRKVLEDAPLHFDDTRGSHRDRKRDMLWLIYVACYSGCRLEELCQLARDNVRQVRDIWVLDINDGEGRKLKNEFSRRLVPIHPVLIERGFVQFATDENGIGARVFSSLRLVKTVQGATYGNAASSAFGRYLDKLGLTDPTLNFHSFRHTFIEAMRNAEVPYSIELALVGHRDNHNPVHGGYGGAAKVELLAKWIGNLDPLV